MVDYRDVVAQIDKIGLYKILEPSKVPKIAEKAERDLTELIGIQCHGLPKFSDEPYLDTLKKIQGLHPAYIISLQKIQDAYQWYSDYKKDISLESDEFNFSNPKR